MARNTDLRIQIDADAAKAEQAFQRATRAIRSAEDALSGATNAAAQLDKQLNDELAANARKQAEAQEKLGRGLVAFGAATLAGLGMATKAAMDWESAWAGVTKTVDGSPQQMAALEAELRGLADTLPATHAEIAGVAEAAGQLGVATEDVATFTKVMIDLGETTNLTAEEAAMAIAQMMNVMQTAPDEVSNLGSALVDLGNNSATTERDILMLAQRLAAAGAQVGMSEADVLAFATAMSSLGIQAEAGGTAISRVMSDMSKAVSQGGDSLEGFAEVAGMSAEEFATAFEEDPARAILAFTQGLDRIKTSGGDVFTTLDDLGLGGLRVRDSLLRLSGGGDILADSLDRSAQAWDENNALVKEAQTRYDTTEAKISMAKNSLVNFAIDIGGVVLPYVADLAEGVASVLQWFSDLPGPVKTAGTVLAGLIGTASLVGGGFLLLAPRIKAARDLLGDLGPNAQRAGRAMSGLGRALGFAGAALTLSYALIQLRYASDDLAPSVSGATESLLNLADGKIDDSVQSLVDLKDQVSEISDRNWFESLADQVFTLDGALDDQQAIDEYKARLESLDTALAGMVQGGHMEQAEASARALQDALGFDDADFDAFIAHSLPGYADALKNVDNEQRIAGDSALGAAEGFTGVGVAAEEVDPFLADLAARFGEAGEGAEKAAQQILDSWSEGFQEFVDIVGVYDEALSAKEEAEKRTAQATADATDDASDSWEDYYTDVELSFEEYLEALEEQVAAQEKWATNMAILAARGVDDGVLAKLAEMGPAGADLVAQAASASDEELRKFEDLFDRSGQNSGDNFAAGLAAAGPLWKKIAETQGQDTVDELISELESGEITWTEILNRYGHLLDEKVPPTQGTDVYAEVKAAQANVNRFGDDADHATREREMPVSADTDPATRIIDKFVADENMRKVTLQIKAKIESFLGNFGFGGGGGGSGGGASSGGWRTPMNRGSYRVGGGVGSYPGHTGQDLPARIGTPVYAARGGRVTRSMDMRGSYGRHVYIDHGSGYQTRYAHLSARGVSAGQMVGSGQYIGAVGSTGNSTGPHLHFEVRRSGRVLNPRSLMRFARGGPIEGPGGPRDDMVPLLGSNGEFMMQAAARAHYGDQIMHAINNMELPKLALGGGVGPSVTAASGGGREIVNYFNLDGPAVAQAAEAYASAVVTKQRRAEALAAWGG